MRSRCTRRASRARTGAGIALALALAGCFTDAEGRQPPPDRLVYPTGLVVSPGGTTLYVANSDFDLLYSGGSVLALDLTALRGDVLPLADALADGADASAACGAVGRSLNRDEWLNPGPCAPFDVAPYVRASAFIGAFASGVLLVHDPEASGARLFVPVRGDPSITYFEVADDRAALTAPAFTPSFQLDCASGPDGFCGPDHRLGQDREKTLRGIQLPADPLGIAASADGRAIVSTHQTQASASLVVNPWDQIPALSYFISGLASGPTEVATIPEPGFAALAGAAAEAAGARFDYQPGFLVTYRGSPQIDILRYAPDSGAVPPRPFLVRAAAVPITTTASAFDSRGVAVVASERRRCEATCEALAEPLACLEACAEEVPMQLFLANRAPASLLVGTIDTVINRNADGVATSAFDEITFFDSIPLNFGASRVEVGLVIDENGELAERVFAVCFDARQVFVIDPEELRVEAVVRTGRGPHDVAFDSGMRDGEPYAHLHVGHFTDSYIGVVELDRRRPVTYGQMFATIGVPTPPTESR